MGVGGFRMGGCMEGVYHGEVGWIGRVGGSRGVRSAGGFGDGGVRNIFSFECLVHRPKANRTLYIGEIA